MTKNQYLEMMGRLTTGMPLIVKVEGNKSGITLSTKPVTITVSDDQEFVNRFFTSGSPSDSFDVEAMAKEMGFSEEEFKLFTQRMCLYHEAGHALFTPEFTPKQLDPARKQVLNFVEDTRIESKLSAHYPPTRNRLTLFNRMLLSRIDLNDAIEKVKQNPDKRNVAMLATTIASQYYYNMTDKEPVSPAIKRMVEITGELWDNPKTTFNKHTQKYTDEIYSLIPGLTIEELQNEAQNLVSGDEQMDEEGEPQSGPSGNDFDDMKKQLAKSVTDQMNDFKDDIKSFGIELKNRDDRNLDNVRYYDQTLINQLYQTLKQIMGGKPSKQNIVDYDGHSLDIEGVIEFLQDPRRECKMYEKAGKKERPELYLAFAIDASGSMSGGKIESAKKGAINLALACEKLGIKTCIMDFATDVKVHKDFEQPLIESDIGELMASGGTDISCAVKKTTELLDKRKISPNTKCALIILSDGCDGTASQVGRLLADNKHIQMYMIGIWDDPERYVIDVRKSGGACYGHEHITDISTVSKVMQNFAKNFVRRC